MPGPDAGLSITNPFAKLTAPPNVQGPAVATVTVEPSTVPSEPIARQKQNTLSSLGDEVNQADPHKTQVLPVEDTKDGSVVPASSAGRTLDELLRALQQAPRDEDQQPLAQTLEAPTSRAEQFPRATIADFEWREWQEEAIQTLESLKAPQVQLSGENVLALIRRVREANEILLDAQKDAQNPEYEMQPGERTIDIAHAVEDVGQEYLVAMHRKLFAQQFISAGYEFMPDDVKKAFDTLCNELILFYNPHRIDSELEQAYTNLQSTVGRYKAGNNPFSGMLNGVRESRFGEWMSIHTSLPNFLQHYQRTLRQSTHNFHQTSHGVEYTTFAPVKVEVAPRVPEDAITEETPAVIPNLQQRELLQHHEDVDSQRALIEALQATPDIVASRLHVFSLPLLESTHPIHGKIRDIDLQEELDWVTQYSQDRVSAWRNGHFVTLGDVKASSQVSKEKAQSLSLVDQILADSGQNFLLVSTIAEITEPNQNLGLIVPAEFSNTQALQYLRQQLPKNITLIPLDTHFSQNLARCIVGTLQESTENDEGLVTEKHQAAIVYDDLHPLIPFADGKRGMIGIFGTTHEEYFTNAFAQEFSAAIYVDELAKLDSEASSADLQAAFRRANRRAKHAWRKYTRPKKHQKRNNELRAAGIGTRSQEQLMLEQTPTAAVVKIVNMTIDGQLHSTAVISYTGAQEVLKISPDGTVVRLTMDPNLQEALQTKKMTFAQAQYVQNRLDGIDSDKSFADVIREEVWESIDEAYQTGNIIPKEIRDAEALLGILKVQGKTGWTELKDAEREALIKVLPSYLQELYMYYTSRLKHTWATPSRPQVLHEYVEAGDVLVVTSAASLPRSWAGIYTPALSLDQLLHEVKMHGSFDGKGGALTAVALRVGER